MDHNKAEDGTSGKGISVVRNCNFGIRCLRSDQFKKPIGPGPSAYALVGSLTRFGSKSGPAFSIGKREKVFVKKGANESSITSVEEVIPEQHAAKPEPSSRTKGFTLGARLPVVKKQETPGPSHYEIPSSIGKATPNKRSAAAGHIFGINRGVPNLTGPGPAKYSPNTSWVMKKSPSFSMGKKVVSKSERAKPQTPAPNAYFLKGEMEVKKNKKVS